MLQGTLCDRGWSSHLLLFGAEEVLEVVKEVVESFDVGGVGALLALHSGDDDFVAEGELCEVGLFVGTSFGEFESLGEEVVKNGVLEGLGVGLLVHDPAGELVSVFGGVFGELDDLS